MHKRILIVLMLRVSFLLRFGIYLNIKHGNKLVNVFVIVQSFTAYIYHEFTVNTRRVG